MACARHNSSCEISCAQEELEMMRMRDGIIAIQMANLIFPRNRHQGAWRVPESPNIMNSFGSLRYIVLLRLLVCLTNSGFARVSLTCICENGFVDVYLAESAL